MSSTEARTLLRAAGFEVTSWGGPLGGPVGITFKDAIGHQCRVSARDVPGWLADCGRTPTSDQVRIARLEEGLRDAASEARALRLEVEALRESAQRALFHTDPVLCYCDGGTAWFTFRPLAKQWGDDWNDAPYEHNAGDPYSHDYVKVDGEDRCVGHMLVTAEYGAGWMTPDHEVLNSRYSVEAINAGETPWLRSRGGHELYAGATLTEFRRMMFLRSAP